MTVIRERKWLKPNKPLKLPTKVREKAMIMNRYDQVQNVPRLIRDTMGGFRGGGGRGSGPPLKKH